ncbi:MAG: FHA domain-containing protein [Actinobacteria bacterium]|nr:MAG: FHA domain-containing protein [Actinomycetota bacterium]
MAYTFCNSCGHRNPPESTFCSACGTVLDHLSQHTIVLAKVDPLQDAPGDDDNVQVELGEIHAGHGLLVMRSGERSGERFALTLESMLIGRNPECGLCLDDVTVSRRHAAVDQVGGCYEVTDLGSLNGTYVNQQRVDQQTLGNGDELQIGKYRMVFFDGASI